MRNNAGFEQLIHELQQKGIDEVEVLAAMRTINRENFVDPIDKIHAFEDKPLSIACQQTISQPYIVAKMTCLLLNGKEHVNKVLEIGTGSGYQAAILSCLAMQVYSIERINTLHQIAKKRLATYQNIHLFLSDNSESVNQYGPFDGIIVTACCSEIESQWLEALTDGGFLVFPLSIDYYQQLM